MYLSKLNFMYVPLYKKTFLLKFYPVVIGSNPLINKTTNDSPRHINSILYTKYIEEL